MLYSHNKHRGFTLIELLVVIIILAILAAIVIPRFVGRTDDARITAAVSQIKSFDMTMDMFHADTGTYPPTLDALMVNPGGSKWKGPYLKNEKIPLDPWEHPYIYKTPGDNGREYDISSAGPDGQIGTADDIKGWDLQSQGK